jgi:hypothetical protein
VRFFKFIRNLYLLNRRLDAEKELQRDSGYEVRFVQEGPEQYFYYRKGDEEFSFYAEFSYLNTPTFFTRSLIRTKGSGAITEQEREIAFQRIVQFLSCWGDVVLDDSPSRRGRFYR